MYQGSLKGVSWQFQLWSKKVSRVFKESVRCFRKLQIKYQEFSNTFICNFLLLHGSHRSYLSRRRACSLRNGLTIMLWISWDRFVVCDIFVISLNVKLKSGIFLYIIRIFRLFWCFAGLELHLSIGVFRLLKKLIGGDK